MATKILTQARLKELLHYDPETGLFTWIASPAKNVRAGSSAGGLDGKGYKCIRVDGVLSRAHRLAYLWITGRLPTDQVDHINHIRDDNRWCNLRLATNQENNRNQTLRCTNKSGITGVRMDRSSGRWIAGIMLDGINKGLYYGDDFFTACCARKSADIKHGFHPNHGEVL